MIRENHSLSNTRRTY